MEAALKIEHNLQKLAFVLKMVDNSICQLEYRQHPNRVLEFYHTEVPKKYEGQGLAKKLVKEGFKYALNNDYKVLPTCSYVAKYVEKMANNEERNIVVKSLV